MKSQLYQAGFEVGINWAKEATEQQKSCLAKIAKNSVAYHSLLRTGGLSLALSNGDLID